MLIHNLVFIRAQWIQRSPSPAAMRRRLETCWLSESSRANTLGFHRAG